MRTEARYSYRALVLSWRLGGSPSSNSGASYSSEALCRSPDLRAPARRNDIVHDTKISASPNRNRARNVRSSNASAGDPCDQGRTVQPVFSSSAMATESKPDRLKRRRVRRDLLLSASPRSKETASIDATRIAATI